MKEEKKATAIAAGLDWHSDDSDEESPAQVQAPKELPLPKLLKDDEHYQLILDIKWFSDSTKTNNPISSKTALIWVGFFTTRFRPTKSPPNLPRPKAGPAKADATAKGISRISESIKRSGGFEAASLRIAEQYIDAFRKIAQDANTTMLLPSNPANPAGMMGQALRIYKTIIANGSSGGGGRSPLEGELCIPLLRSCLLCQCKLWLRHSNLYCCTKQPQSQPHYNYR